VPIVEVNGVRIYYELHGPSNAPVLVLNNGILMDAALSWMPQTAAFSSEWRVLQYDCRGQGQSGHPATAYSMAQHADDLAGLLTALGIERAHVAGISYGGEVAQAFALAHPRRVLSLILADTVSEVGPELRLIVEGWREAAWLKDPDLFFLVTAPWNFSASFVRSRPAVLEAARRRYADLDFPAVARLCDAFLNLHFTPQLSALRMPTCILVGERDILKGPAYASILHGAIPHSELHVVPCAGHALSWERPDDFNAIVLGFLRR
jgi:3-oxoadipate enol-lactonase